MKLTPDALPAFCTGFLAGVAVMTLVLVLTLLPLMRLCHGLA